jgi:hypothetical protein
MLAPEISAVEGIAEAAQVDALDEQAFEEHTNQLAERAGSIVKLHATVTGKSLEEILLDLVVPPCSEGCRWSPTSEAINHGAKRLVVALCD